jgi:hypothetical protein
MVSGSQAQQVRINSHEIDTRLSSVGAFLNPQFPNTNFGLEQRWQNNEIFPAPLMIHEPEIEGAKSEFVENAERLADPANCLDFTSARFQKLRHGNLR